MLPPYRKLLLKIYRLVSFDHFADSIHRKALSFVTYDMWPGDPYEGYILRLIETEEGRLRITDHLRRKLPTILPPDAVVGMLDRFRKTIHLQSWTKRQAESEMLWSRYSHEGTAVRISTSLEKVGRLKGVSYVEVDYFEKLSLEDELPRVVGGNKFDCSRLFTSKRIEYDCEEEIRLMTDANNAYLPGRPRDSARDELMRKAIIALSQSGQLTPEETKTGLDQVTPPNHDIRHVSFAHVDDFIESVTAHPSASDRFVLKVERYCYSNKIKFLGKSRLYSFD